jgi:hypothetical protein
MASGQHPLSFYNCLGEILTGCCSSSNIRQQHVTIQVLKQTKYPGLVVVHFSFRIYRVMFSRFREMMVGDVANTKGVSIDT